MATNNRWWGSVKQWASEISKAKQHVLAHARTILKGNVENRQHAYLNLSKEWDFCLGMHCFKEYTFRAGREKN